MQVSLVSGCCSCGGGVVRRARVGTVHDGRGCAAVSRAVGHQFSCCSVVVQGRSLPSRLQ